MKLSESEQKDFDWLLERGQMLRAREIEARHKISEECSRRLWEELENLTDNLRSLLNPCDQAHFMKICKKNIMSIIRGENEA